MFRKPSDEEYYNFNGLHCFRLWSKLDDNWRCPSCGRNKRQIMIWGKRQGNNAKIYGKIGFKCGLHQHHDHSGEERFQQTILCNGCNSLDGRLKRILNTKKEFSFSPEELHRIIKRALPNKSIQDSDVDYELAYKIYSNQTHGISPEI